MQQAAGGALPGPVIAHPAMPWVALDGGIGVGKTTTLGRLREAGVAVLEEPVGDPATNKRGPWDDLLDDMYKQLPGAAFAFQKRVVADRALSKLATQLGQSKTSWACMERSPDMQRRTFLRMQGFGAEQLRELEALYDEAAALWRPAAIIYLRVPPEVSFARMQRRARASEAGVTLEYHTRLHEAHEAAVVELREEGVVPVTCIDAAGMSDEEVATAVLKAYKSSFVR